MKKRKLKIKNVIFLLIIIGLIIVGIYFFNKKEETTSEYLTIKLNGNSDITLNYQEEYKEEGATAQYKDEDISNNIIIDSNIDLETIGTYQVTYTIEHNNYTKMIKRNVTIIDKEKPVITLNGKDNLTIYVNDKYSEQGAKAIDNYDKDLTDKIDISSNLDTSKKGTYQVTYRVTDSSNNEVTALRTVNVIEKKVTETNANTSTSETTISSGKTSKGFDIEVKNGVTYIDGILIANKTYKLPSSYNPGGLLKVFTDNFNEMKEDAKKDGVKLVIGSGFRSYSKQESIYNNYVKRDGKAKADTYSARPGHSEHQTGLAADIYGEDSKDLYLYQAWGETKDGKWVNANCYKYGFIIRFVKGKEDSTGYMYESWHIRYVGKELAEKLYNNGDWITLEDYFGITSKYN